MTTPLLANELARSLSSGLKKVKDKNLEVVFLAEGGKHFKIGKVEVCDDGIALIEADRYSAPIGFHT